ncbi:hypothetical protein HU200_052833 [Digitaria exilis]|uniref:DUF4149 domain-containing protein n=1 Tax=Digitaria exilis TaxID=1010633 RepID=A0A835AIL2_9POAL|nr:hypothetical protein HU200_052833 [Digitaria exilis]
MLLLLVAVAVFFAGGFIMSPEDSFGGSPGTTVVKVVHLLCLATSWGATVWAIFVGGLVFPACFRLTAASTAMSAAAFAWLHLHHPWQAASAVEHRQLVVLLTAVGLDLANLFIFIPRTLKFLQVMQERHKVERSLGIGGQVFLDGWRCNVQAATSSAALAAVNGRFRAAHVRSAVATLASSVGLAAHTWYLAGKLEL